MVKEGTRLVGTQAELRARTEGAGSQTEGWGLDYVKEFELGGGSISIYWCTAVQDRPN